MSHIEGPKVVLMWLVLATFAALVACSSPEPEHLVRPDYLVEDIGGATSAREFRGRPFHQSARSLDFAEFRRFGVGAVSFNQRMEPKDGLGPTFNENSCLNCHLDGEREVDVDPTLPGPGLLLRLSISGATMTGAPAPDPVYGGQLQTKAVPGAVPEGTLTVKWRIIKGHYPDGSAYELRQPVFSVIHLAGGPLSPQTMTSARVAPPIVGLGLLEAIPEATIRAAADPDDANHDGISGRVNIVWDAVTGSTALGRFGWKAGQPTVAQQSEVALHDDMGMTSANFLDPCSGQGSLCREPAPGTPRTPELTTPVMDDQIFYNRTIAVPIAKDVNSPAVIRGSRLFVDTGCAACHTTTQRSGPDEVVGLANQTFHPFTDMLLHDMGEGLADHRPEFDASGSEWRTPPLWTISRHTEVYGFPSLLHDGRARSGEEAILWHGGEAGGAKNRFMRLAASKRHDLLAYLDTL